MDAYGNVGICWDTFGYVAIRSHVWLRHFMALLLIFLQSAEKLGMEGLGINLGDAYYINGVFAAGFRGRPALEDSEHTWTRVVARPTCYIGRKILEDFGLPKTFSMRPNSNQGREECKVLACAWVDRMHFLSQHLSLARCTTGEAICTQSLWGHEMEGSWGLPRHE